MENADLPSTARMSREVVLDAKLGATKAIRRIEARRITMPAGLAAGLHVHNGPVVGSVVSGSIAFQIEGQTEQRLDPGDVFYEPEGTRIARFDAGDEGAVFLAFFPLEADQESEIAFL